MRILGLQRTILRKIHVSGTVEGPLPGIHRWRIILVDTNFFQQSVSVPAVDYKGILNRPSTFYQIH